MHLLAQNGETCGFKFYLLADHPTPGGFARPSGVTGNKSVKK